MPHMSSVVKPKRHVNPSGYYVIEVSQGIDS